MKLAAKNKVLPVLGSVLFKTGGKVVATNLEVTAIADSNHVLGYGLGDGICINAEILKKITGNGKTWPEVVSLEAGKVRVLMADGMLHFLSLAGDCFKAEDFPKAEPALVSLKYPEDYMEVTEADAVKMLEVFKVVDREAFDRNGFTDMLHVQGGLCYATDANNMVMSDVGISKVLSLPEGLRPWWRGEACTVWHTPGGGTEIRYADGLVAACRAGAPQLRLDTAKGQFEAYNAPTVASYSATAGVWTEWAKKGAALHRTVAYSPKTSPTLEFAPDGKVVMWVKKKDPKTWEVTEVAAEVEVPAGLFTVELAGEDQDWGGVNPCVLVKQLGGVDPKAVVKLENKGAKLADGKLVVKPWTVTVEGENGVYRRIVMPVVTGKELVE